MAIFNKRKRRQNLSELSSLFMTRKKIIFQHFESSTVFFFSEPHNFYVNNFGWLHETKELISYWQCWRGYNCHLRGRPISYTHKTHMVFLHILTLIHQGQCCCRVSPSSPQQVLSTERCGPMFSASDNQTWAVTECAIVCLKAISAWQLHDKSHHTPKIFL